MDTTLVAGAVFIGAVIVGVTRFVQLVSDPVTRNKAWIIIFAVITGIFVALLDTKIGVADVTVAQGIMIALAAVGVVTTAEKIG